jgi:hypothetical protein
VRSANRYRGAAMAEFWRALGTLKALQAEAKSVEQPPASAHTLQASSMRSPRPLAGHAPNEPERRSASAPGPRLDYALPDRSAPRGTLHELAAPWMPNEPERHPASAPRVEYVLPDRPAPGALHGLAAPWMPNEPERHPASAPRVEYVLPDGPAPGVLHGLAAPWMQNEPERRSASA